MTEETKSIFGDDMLTFRINAMTRDARRAYKVLAAADRTDKETTARKMMRSAAFYRLKRMVENGFEGYPRKN